jgi:hypothetical protein
MVQFQMIRLLEGIKTDTWLLGYVRQIMYSARIHNVQHLKQPIREAAASVSADVLGWVWQEMQYRFDVCRVTDEAHIELHNHRKKLYQFFFNIICLIYVSYSI